MTTLWDKISAWAQSTIQTVEADAGAAVQAAEKLLNWEEQQLVALLQPLFASAEAEAMQDLTLFLRGVLTSSQNISSLPDWETAVLNSLQKVGGDLLTTAEKLGSNALQVLIGLLLSQLQSPQSK